MAETKVTDNKAVLTIIGAIAAAVIGFALIGPRTAQEKQSQDVLNLPAVVEKVESNEQNIGEIREGARSDLRAFESRNQDERNRRERETYDYVALITAHNAEISRLHADYAREARARQDRFNEMVLDHINTPEATHGHGNE